jgi:hypothetical protein
MLPEDDISEVLIGFFLFIQEIVQERERILNLLHGGRVVLKQLRIKEGDLLL